MSCVIRILIYIVESWLKFDDQAIIGALEDRGHFRLINKPRVGRVGGGICCLYKAHYNVKNIPTIDRKTMETLETFIQSQNKNLTVVTIYRPEVLNKIDTAWQISLMN